VDGGGMRGIYSAAYLAALERAFCRQGGLENLDIGKAFRLIVGTSTGAIIGCGLAKGLSPQEIVKLYSQNGSLIFKRKLPSKIDLDLLHQLAKRSKLLREGRVALRRALTNVFETMTIKGLWQKRGIALAIPAVNMATYRPWIFKTPHDPSTNHRDDDLSLVDVCLATSAAPLFRSLAAIEYKGGGHDVFADGGLWANNPVLVAMVEAFRMQGDGADEIEIFALGTCGKPEGEVIPIDALDRGLAAWRFWGEAAKVSIAAQEYAFDMIVRLLEPHLKSRVRIIRFPSEKIPGALLKYLDLDETTPQGLEALMGQARRDADMTNSSIQRGTAEGKAIHSLFSDMSPQIV
jgi:hypothetical protein